MGDLRVKKAPLDHDVSKDLLEATERLGFERQPQAQVGAVCAKPFIPVEASAVT